MNLGVGREVEVKEITQKFFYHQTLSSKENQVNKRSDLTPDESQIFHRACVFCVLVFIGGVNLSGNSNSALPSPQHQLGAI